MDHSPPVETPWDEGDLEMRVMEGPPPAGFDCGREEQTRFLYERAWRDMKRGITATHLLYVKGILAAYATLMMDRLVLGPQEKPKGVTYRYVGALKLAQLAVGRPFAGRGLGRFMVAYTIQFARAVRPAIGCRMVTLDAEPGLVAWYERMGFRRNLEDQSHREQLAARMGKSIDHLPVSMRFDLRDVGDEFTD